MVYKKVELYSKPEWELKEIMNMNYSEMTSFQRSFLCGLIKENRPKKIVELGVSVGGTTALVLLCLMNLNIKADMYSVDLMEDWYRNKKYETGFVAKRMLDELQGETRHRFCLGKSMPFFIEQIGKNIDFLILDTTHCLPGELLDFIVCLPYLKDGCIVVMHDIVENHLTCRDMEIATKLLFDVVRAEDKYFMREEKANVAELANIAAFKVDKETRKGIRDYISALTVSWGYMLDEFDKQKYRESILKNYGEEYLKFFDRIENLQGNTSLQKKIEIHFGKKIEYLKAQWENSENVLLYGAGYFAGLYYQWGKSNQYKIDGLIISDDQEKIINKDIDLPIYFLSEIPYKPTECIIIVAVEQKHQDSVLRNLNRAGYYNIL